MTAELTVDKTEFMCLEPVECFASLHNSFGQVVHDINTGCASGAPIFLLTDAETGAVIRGSEWNSASADAFTVDLQPGATMSRRTTLSDVISLPGAGTYDLRALYEWPDGGRATSPPARLVVRPAVPRAMDIETLCGGWNYLSFAAWVNETSRAEQPFTLWFSHLDLFTKPRVTSCVRLAELPRIIQPFLSVAPNTDPVGLWLGWIDEASFHYLHGQESFSAEQSIPLPRPDLRVIPPLLQDAADTNSGQTPGVSVLLHEPADYGPGRLLVLRIKPSNEFVLQELAAIPDSLWSRTAYLSDSSCHTFLLLPGPEGQCLLCYLGWSTSKPGARLKELDVLNLRFIAADLRVMEDDAIHIVIFGEVNPHESGRYNLRQWFLSASHDSTTRMTDFDLPQELSITDAVVRISANGAAYILAHGAEDTERWMLIRDDGSVVSLPMRMQAPVDILFRSSATPVILYTDPGRGLQFL